ncbi:MAG: hypothetical protein IRY89_05775 [Pseudolabrys sp.]|nr:hypothetical protein [Pseudolabrys sp.]
MADQIRYDLLTQQALRGVVRSVLADTAQRGGLPGDHHFFIAFDTTHAGVRMPDRLRAQYPQQITIVLQHQFWDLKVSEDAFEVGLSFGGVPTKLTVPFEAITKFIDPAAQFSLQFEEIGEDSAGEAANAAEKNRGAGADRRADNAGESGARLPAASAQSSSVPRTPATDEEPTPPAGGAQVVRLDRFRKK